MNIATFLPILTGALGAALGAHYGKKWKDRGGLGAALGWVLPVVSLAILWFIPHKDGRRAKQSAPRPVAS